jgi:hypothetical protein
VGEIVLTGLKVNTPIGAMAAFGLLRLNPNWHLSWKQLCAVVTAEEEIAPDAIVQHLADKARARCDDRYEFQWSETGKLREADPEKWRAAVRTGQARKEGREQLDWLAALGVPVTKEFARSPFDFTSGSQSFLMELANLPGRVTKESVREALFGPWLYNDSTHSLGWDPAMMRGGAFTAEQPRENKRKRGVTAAVWLASESLPLFPCFVNERGMLTARGWTEREFRWPLWETPISLGALVSLLCNLEGRHDVAVYAAAKIKAGRQSGFNSARLVCEY